MAIVALIVVLVVVGAIMAFFWGLLAFVRSSGNTPVRRRDDAFDREGELHSGPYGYTPDLAYPETQYGSGFDTDAEWYEERH